MNPNQQPNQRTRDAGAMLPMVLVITTVLSLVIVAVANYTAAGLRYGQVVEDRSDRLAAADGGMRYAVERLTLGAARICSAGGSDEIDPPDINNSTVTVSCQQVGDGFDDITGWAMVLTGEDLPAGKPLVSTAAGAAVAKLVGGPVYMHTLDFDILAPLEFRYSQLLHTSDDCTADATNPTLLPLGVTFDSTSLGVDCTPRPWSRDDNPSNGLFSAPNIGVLPTNLNPEWTGNGSCRVFSPGHYTTAPVLGGNNYFISGNYIFDGFTFTVKNSKVTAGKSNGDGASGDTQFIPNTPCNNARTLDPGDGVTTSGATFYMQNGANIELNSNGLFEVLRRKQGKSYVSVHVLEPSVAAPTTLTWNQDIIDQGAGTNKDMVMHGLVWAPTARVTFGLVTNTADGQLLGGGVLSNIVMNSSAVGAGFVISVEPSDFHGKLQLDSTAVLDGRSTTIRSIIDHRPSTNYTAVTSWRVID